MTFRRRKPRHERLTIRHGVIRAGRVGVPVYRDGNMTGWGLNESAALASAQVAA